MVERRWPPLRQRLAQPDDVLDDAILRVRPTAEELDLIQQEAEVWLAERGLPRDLDEPPAKSAVS
jgi:hypothetical protein